MSLSYHQRTMKSSHILGLGLLGLWLFPAAALAVDGVIEINQARALAGGVTPGDTAGFPVTIDHAGSYRLTSNLDLTAQPSPEDIVAIEVTADNVSIDMNGFSILGTTACTFVDPPVCTPAGTGAGIKATSSENLAVTNGSVNGVGGTAIDADSGRVERVQVTNIAGVGIRIGNGEVVNCRVKDIGSNGISFTTNGVARDNQVRHVGGSGIKMAFGVFIGNFVAGAFEDGITAGQGSTVTNDDIASNHLSGINADGGTIVNNTIRSGDAAGILVSANGSTILGNSIFFNGGLGIEASAGAGSTGFGNNVINLNNGGNANPQVSAGLRELGTNVCGGDTTCP